MDVIKAIQQLDPEVDAQKICFLSSAYHFPEDNRLSLELALFRTFCVPSIGELLERTQQFTKSPQKRYDDTSLILAEIVENGLDTDRGQRALARMNEIHSRFPISNRDYLYVLSTFIYEPIRWNKRFGWREVTEKEKLAGYYLWREIGKRMGIVDIPASYADFERFNQEYEQKHFQYSPRSRRVADATLGLLLKKVPPRLHGLARQGIYSLLDEPVLHAFDYPAPHPIVRGFVLLLLRCRAFVLRMAPKRRTPLRRTELSYPSYPHGYVIEGLGADRSGSAAKVTRGQSSH